MSTQLSTIGNTSPSLKGKLAAGMHLDFGNLTCDVGASSVTCRSNGASDGFHVAAVGYRPAP